MSIGLQGRCKKDTDSKRQTFFRVCGEARPRCDID